MLLNIGLHTNQIVNDYLAATGKIGYGSILSPQEYLLFRQQAIEEEKQGICINQNHTANQHIENAHNEATVSAMEITAKEKPQKTTSLPSSEPDKAPAQTPKETGKITPITQKTKSNSNTEQMLAIMRSVDS